MSKLDPGTVTAAARVFAIPELLEHILCALGNTDVRSVFALQRVNTLFNDTINTSKWIRRIICLEPLPKKDKSQNSYPDAPVLNPLCYDPQIGCLLWPALLYAWPDSKSSGASSDPVFIDCRTARPPKDWEALQRGSWRKTMIGQTAASYPMRAFIWRTAASEVEIAVVNTHDTLGEVVDRCHNLPARASRSRK